MAGTEEIPLTCDCYGVEVCEICEKAVPLYEGICGPCWWEGVDEGIIELEILPNILRRSSRR